MCKWFISFKRFPTKSERRIRFRILIRRVDVCHHVRVPIRRRISTTFQENCFHKWTEPTFPRPIEDEEKSNHFERRTSHFERIGPRSESHPRPDVFDPSSDLSCHPHIRSHLHKDLFSPRGLVIWNYVFQLCWFLKKTCICESRNFKITARSTLKPFQYNNHLITTTTFYKCKLKFFCNIKYIKFTSSKTRGSFCGFRYHAYQGFRQA